MNCDCLVYSVSQSVTTEFASLYDEESARTLGVPISLGRKNGLMRRRQHVSRRNQKRLCRYLLQEQHDAERDGDGDRATRNVCSH